ncbi:Hint domain-containing protein [Sulfitobacter aestuarii]|uniref:Hint domain-containing protein n=1 Tax=Sulfitobacter aestuarii TaxID=2161676 RepID=A0ABW5TZI3_9RHOB
MVTRSFFATDSDTLTVISGSNTALLGNGVINNSDTPDGTVFRYTGGTPRKITIEDSSALPDVMEDDLAGQHVVLDGGGIVAEGTPIEAESLIGLWAIDDQGHAVGDLIVITVFSQNGVAGDVFGFTSDTPLTPGTSYVKVGGNNLGSNYYSNFITCFAAGTLIDTVDGRRPVEELKAGDLVLTRDHGAQPLRWCGMREVAGQDRFAPVRFAPGAWDNETVLLVSPQHRMLLTSPLAELLFGHAEMLIAAKFLVGLPGIDSAPCPRIRYCHVMCDAHQIIRGNGCWSESFFLSDMALEGSSCAARAELLALFPDLPAGIARFGDTAAPVLKAREAALLRAALREPDTAAPASRLLSLA